MYVCAETEGVDLGQEHIDFGITNVYVISKRHLDHPSIIAGSPHGKTNVDRNQVRENQERGYAARVAGASARLPANCGT